MAEGISRIQLYILMILLAISGAVQVTVLKIQNGIIVYDKESDKNRQFYHPFVQAFAMTIGQFLWFIVYYIYEYYQISKYGSYDNIPEVVMAKEEGLETKINAFLLIIPSFFDLWENTLLFISLTIMSASVFQMLQGVSVLITALFSLCILGSKQYRHHWVALVLIVWSLGLVGATPLLYRKGDEEESTNSYFAITVAIVLILIAEMFEGGHMISEEKIFDDYYIHPLKMAGWEGVWGIIIYWITLFVLQNIKWQDDDYCPYGTVENTTRAIFEMKEHKTLWILMIVYIIFLALYNAFGVALTKYSSATVRTTIMISHTAAIWVFFIFYPGPGQETFQWMQLIGFIFLIIGILMYNEILIIPFWGLDMFINKDHEAHNFENSPDLGPESDSFMPSEGNMQEMRKGGSQSLRLSQYAVLSQSSTGFRTALNE